ncbi:MAG: DAK2 domain-containing protein [Chloroflexi bacterium]|nr:DAK2 domain-containing protein [Chloroflexota bacterium]
MAETTADSGAFPASVDGAGLVAMVEASARAIEHNQAEINALNVFPVPDGDTGTNMCLTLLSVISSIAETAPGASKRSADAVAAAMASAALLGARGNSGLILAQYFFGLSAALDKHQFLGGPEFAHALKQASDAAYRAVQDPVEGTMLTVIRCAADAAADACRESESLSHVLSAVSTNAQKTVAETPGMLDVLAKAGVVDAGGHGLSVMFAGALSYLRGESSGAIELSAPTPAGMEDGTALREFLESAREVDYGYCTGFVIEGDGLDVEVIREKIGTLGKSTVVAGDAFNVKVHVHPLNPGPVLTYAAELGTLSNVSILNMGEQTRQRADQAALAGMLPLAPDDDEQFEVAVVAVASGDGMRRIFSEAGLGASSAVEGGDSMNPSVSELVDAVEAARAANVVILPNNPNVIGTAGQVDALTSKTVRVVPTRTMQQGISALLAFSPESDLEANTAIMADAIDQVSSLAITVASRHFELNGAGVSVGDAIALRDGEIVAAGNSIAEVAIVVVADSSLSGELVTIYRGEGGSEEEAARIKAAASEAHQEWEVEIVDGGQPHYPYLISIE